MAPTINELHSKALGGDSQAEKQLFEALRDRFLFFAHQKVWNETEAEDIVQNALATVLTAHRSLEIETSFAAWAHKVMENKFLSYIQRKRRQDGRAIPMDNPDDLAKPEVPDPTLKMKLLKCLKRVGRINRRYARIINLHFQGYTRQEVCEKLQINTNQSYVSMSRARSMLKECLEKGDLIK